MERVFGVGATDKTMVEEHTRRFCSVISTCSQAPHFVPRGPVRPVTDDDK